MNVGSLSLNNGISPGRQRRSLLGKRQSLGHNLLVDLVEFFPLGNADATIGAHAGKILRGVTNGITDGNGALATGFGTGRLLSVVDNEFSGGDRNFTFCAWINPENVAVAPYIGGFWGTGTSTARAYLMQCAGASNYFYYAQGGAATNWIENTTNVVSGEWAFFCGWYDADNNIWGLRVNHNDATKVLSGGTNTGSGAGRALVLGRSQATTNDTSVKSIQRVGFWKRALSSDERAFLYNNGRGRDYPFV